MKIKKNLILILTSILLTSFCSIKKIALNQVANALTSSGNSSVFSGDNDPEFVGDALPFAIKMYESLYIMYANAFLQTPANMMSEEEYTKQEHLLQRAKNLYLRGRDIILNSINSKYTGFSKLLYDKNYKEALAPIKKKDAELLYWGAVGWLGAFAIDPLDMKLGLTVPCAKEMIKKVLELDENYDNGAIHDFYILYYGSMPDYMEGDFKKARYHFKKAIEASKGRKTSPYLSLATTVCVQEQNRKEFRRLLNKAIKIDPNIDKNNRLINILNQRKARWLIEHEDDFFLEQENENRNQNEPNREEQ
jgi:predicted anti-sigma-YlaC factor YlaD